MLDELVFSNVTVSFPAAPVRILTQFCLPGVAPPGSLSAFAPSVYFESVRVITFELFEYIFIFLYITGSVYSDAASSKLHVVFTVTGVRSDAGGVVGAADGVAVGFAGSSVADGDAVGSVVGFGVAVAGAAVIVGALPSVAG